MKTDYKLTQKAWEINHSKLEEGDMYDRIICYAESRNKAKSEFMKMITHGQLGIELNSGEDINYINLPILRSPSYDKFDFEGVEITKGKIEEKLRERERLIKLDEILNNPLITHCYIQKGGYYYRPHSCGYTEYKTRAGVYSKERAVSEARFCSEVYPVPINVEDHDKMLLEEIQEMKLRLINEYED